MNKILVILFALVFTVFAQQTNHHWGMSTTGVEETDPTQVNIDTTSSAANKTLVFDIADFYFVDAFPYADTSGVALLNSDRAVFGTFRTSWDAENAADSVIYTIKAYAGMYTDAAKSAASIDYEETSVTIRTVRAAGDQFYSDNIYFNTGTYKQFPPEVFKIEIQAVADSDNDDSTDVSWDYAYPAIYQDKRERKSDMLPKQRAFETR